MADYVIGQGDTGVVLRRVLEDEFGDAIDIAGATAELTVKPVGGGAAIVDAAECSNDQNGNGSDGSKGKVSYEWQPGETGADGLYFGSFEVTFSGGGGVQTYPNGGYILIQITPDVSNTATEPFASTSELADRLGIELTADEHVRAGRLLLVATGLIQNEAGQTITRVGDSPGNEEILTRRGAYGDRIRLPQRPILSVASITLAGVELSDEEWYLDGDELVRSSVSGAVNQNSFSGFGGGWGAPNQELVIRYSHGFSPIPAVLKAVCLEMVVRVWTNPGAALGEQYGGEQVTYQRANGLLLTDEERRTIRAYGRQAGSVALR